MATKYVCDRCGGEGASKGAVWIVKDPDKGHDGFTYDLCDPCLVDIREALNWKPPRS